MNHVWAAFNPRMIKMTIVAGADSATSITVTGIEKDDDEILAAWYETSGVPTAVLTDEMTITVDSYVENSTTDTTGDVICILWVDKSAGDET